MRNSVQHTKLAILFADISGSTALYDELGDNEALALVTKCLYIMIRELARHQGTLMKTIGDSIMCTFPTPDSALEAACAMQKAIAHDRPGGNRPIYVRIGFHYGNVISEGKEIYGDAVNIAARVTSITRPRQILTTNVVADMLPSEFKEKIHKVTNATFRGKKESLTIYQVNWSQEDLDVTRAGMPQFSDLSKNGPELLLRHNNATITINDYKPSVVVGRGEACDLIIRNTFSSRQHLSIELNFGKFIIADHSANGTFIRSNASDDVHLAHHEMMLHGTGSICLGRPFSDDVTDVIEYLIR
jgi:class 3 adenylate cyclase